MTLKLNNIFTILLNLNTQSVYYQKTAHASSSICELKTSTQSHLSKALHI